MASALPRPRPAPVMSALAQSSQRVANLPDVAERLKAQGLVQDELTLAQFDQFIARDIRKMAKLVRDGGITLE